MTRRLWGRISSVNVQKVLWTLAELGIDYDREDAGFHYGQVDTDAFRALNPNGRIPVWQEPGLTLWESHAIVRYLCSVYGAGTLCPDDAQARAVADQWMEWSGSRAFPPVIQLFFATVRTAPEQRDPARIAALRDEASDVLALLDAHLAERPYVAGDGFTMGDIPLGCVAYRYFNVPVDRPPLPNLEAWYARLSGRPAYRQHVMRFFGTNPDEWAALEVASASEGVL